MKKTICFLIALLMLLTACAPESSETTAPSETVPPKETFLPTETMEVTEPEDNPFVNYTYRYTDDRDRAWEEDVVYLARIALGLTPYNGHPLLIKEEAQVWKMDNFVDFQCFYREDLRNDFITGMEQLILDIPALSDIEILYEMERVVAQLSDLHSYVYLPPSEIFVIMTEPFYSEEGMQLRVVRLPAEYKDALYGQLISINGIPIDEVLERVGQYISHEWEYGKMYYMTNMIPTGMIIRKEALQIAGIVGEEDTSAEFGILTEEGTQILAEIPVVDGSGYKETEKVMGDWYSSDRFSYDRYMDINYFFRYEKENEMMYIRFNREAEVTDYRYRDFFAEIKDELAEGTCEKIVVDLRFNGGGYTTPLANLIGILTQAEVPQVYILIDPASYSGAVTLAVELRQKVPNSLIVGTPAGQSPNFFAGRNYTLPNSGNIFLISSVCYSYWPDYTYETLMPDIIVYQTLDDYKNGIDTVLEYVKRL